MSAPCPTFGYVVTMELVDDGARSRDDLWTAWLAFTEERGLYCSRVRRERLECAVASEAAQATESDLEATRAWLAARPELRAWRVGEIVDLSGG